MLMAHTDDYKRVMANWKNVPASNDPKSLSPEVNTTLNFPAPKALGECLDQQIDGLKRALDDAEDILRGLHCGITVRTPDICNSKPK